MRTVDVGIRHDNNLIVTQFGNIKVITVTFGEAAAESVDHGLYLGICEHLIDAGLLYV